MRKATAFLSPLIATVLLLAGCGRGASSAALAGASPLESVPAGMGVLLSFQPMEFLADPNILALMNAKRGLEAQDPMTKAQEKLGVDPRSINEVLVAVPAATVLQTRPCHGGAQDGSWDARVGVCPGHL